MRAPFRALRPLALAVPLLPSCRHAEYYQADFFYYSNKPEEVIAAYEGALADRGPDRLVGLMKLLSAHLLRQDWEEAEALALKVSVEVNVYLAGQSGERDALSTFGREADKPFKGEPHEQAMADYTLGVLRAMRRDFEGALACFRSALDKDRGTFLLPVETQRARRGASNVRRYVYDPDFATLELLAARCWRLLGEEEEAREMLEEAGSHRPEAAAVFDLAMESETNVIVLVEAGRAPEKVPSGPGGSVLAYRSHPLPRGLKVFLDGKPLPVALGDDLHVQATTLEGRGVDELNRVKAERQRALEVVGITTALAGAMVAIAGRRHRDLRHAGLIGVGAGLLTYILAATAIDPRADLRAWDFLPGAIFVACGRAPPGEHELVVEAQSGELRQVWKRVPVSDPLTVLPVRLLRSHRGGIWKEAPPPAERPDL